MTYERQITHTPISYDQDMNRNPFHRVNSEISTQHSKQISKIKALKIKNNV